MSNHNGRAGDAELVLIDLNEVWQPPQRYDLAQIRDRLAASARDWLPPLFPQARLASDRKTLRCADLSGRPPRKEGSCIIHLSGARAGWGYDHATGESAGPIDIIHYATGLTGPALFEEAARLARIDCPMPPRAVTAKPDHSLEIARILAGCGPLTGTVAETYLRARGLTDPGCPDLLFHPDLADFETKRGWPGIVARVRDRDGEPTGGIHRTYLLDDGSGKAPAGKKMLGDIAGGVVRLSDLPQDGHLGIAEGIETALAASEMFGVPTWAALSADGLRRWQWPNDIRRVTIFADAGDAGMQAAAVLADRLNTSDIPNAIVRPLHGDDFNEDLLKGAVAANYPISAEPVPAPVALQSVDDFEAAARSLTNPPDLKALGHVLGQLVHACLEPLPERQILAALKTATGVPVAILERQIGELRRRLNTTGTTERTALRPRWTTQLRLDLVGSPERNEANIITALSNDEAFAGALVFDEFRQEVLVNRPLPWDDRGVRIPRPWEDADDVRCAEWLQRHEVNVAPVVVSRSVAAIARDIRVHPVREYLDHLRWDGTPRIETWTIAYLGAKDTPLNRAFGSLWLISAIARIFRPGVKADHMLILEGPQGARKSTALKVLAGENWFTDELPELGSKDAALHMQGVWVVEIAELDAIGRAEVSRIKAFLTRTTDRFRPPYGRYTVEVPRQCVFAGTVNPDTYLRDETGNRRFWPLRCGTIDIAALACDRDQLWAEAVARFRTGAIWWIDDHAVLAEASEEQNRRYQSDAWDDLIEHWLVHETRSLFDGYPNYGNSSTGSVPRREPLTDISVGEILEEAIGLEPARWTRGDQMRVSAYLKANGWERYRKRDEGGRAAGRAWRYRRTKE